MRGVFEEPRKQLQRQQASDLDQFVYRLTNPTLAVTDQCNSIEQLPSPEPISPTLPDKGPEMPNKCLLSPDSVPDTKSAKKNWRRRILERKGLKGKVGSSDFDESAEMSFDQQESRDIKDMSFESTSSRSSSGWRSPQISFNCDSSIDASDLEYQTDGKTIQNKKNNDSATESDNNEQKKKETKRQKLKRIITKPLRRSPSTSEKELLSDSLSPELKSSKNKDTMESRAMELLVYQRLFGTSSEDEGRGLRFQKSMSTDSALSENDEGNNNILLKTKSKNIAKNMKKRFPFLRRQQTESVVEPEKNEVDPQTEILSTLTLDRATKWSVSLEDLLHDKSGLDLFLGYLRSEFSEENLVFWIACEEYKSGEDNNLSEMAEKIYNDFVVAQAPKEVNLDADTKTETTSNIENPTRESFSTAQHKIQALMAKDSYPRFIESEYYQLLLENVSKR